MELNHAALFCELGFGMQSTEQAQNTNRYTAGQIEQHRMKAEDKKHLSAFLVYLY